MAALHEITDELSEGGTVYCGQCHQACTVEGRVIPSLDGRRIVQLGIQSRDFYAKGLSGITCGNEHD